MPALNSLRQFAATLKTFFTGKAAPSKTIPFDKKVTHRKLRIPGTQQQQVRIHRREPVSETAID